MPAAILHLTPDNILDFANRYSFYPVDQAEGYKSKNETTLKGKFAGFRHTHVTEDQRVAAIKVMKNPSPTSNRAADYVVAPSLKTTAEGTMGYFLPWDARGAAVELTIPPFKVGDSEAVNPPIFFTAVLSGCSIMFKGTAQKPTIFHCGTAGGGAGAATTGDSNSFFRSMVREIKKLDLGRSNYNTAAQVKSTDYMTTRAGGGAAPMQEKQFKDKLTSHYQGKFLIQGVNMWGVVFGFRKGTDWQFYLQENATISYFDLDKVVPYLMSQASKSLAQTKAGGGFDLTKLTEAQLFKAQSDTAGTPNAITTKMVARPAIVNQVFPGGPKVAKMTNKWRTLKV